MLNIFSCFTVSPNCRNPNTLTPINLVVSSFNSNWKTLNPNTSRLLLFIATAAMSSSPSPAPVKIVAEYAKSGRSSCKKCSKVIASSAMRLGLVSKDPRGFDMTKWHHLNCFPFRDNVSVSSAEAIKGFSSLKVHIF